jgi:catechol 2,3-dioxygenase-like lactoylglutathione lyase family enzyme
MLQILRQLSNERVPTTIGSLDIRFRWEARYAMQLDHATIVTPDLDRVRRFLVEVAGLEGGARPPFRIGGHWLYAGGRPVIHLVQAPRVALAAGRPSLMAPRIDHIALRIDDGDEWQALLARLATSGTAYQLAAVPLAVEVQLFVELAPAVVIEFVRHVSAYGPDTGAAARL